MTPSGMMTTCTPSLPPSTHPSLPRRIANRESARRVRAKRVEMLDELQVCAALSCSRLSAWCCCTLWRAVQPQRLSQVVPSRPCPLDADEVHGPGPAKHTAAGPRPPAGQPEGGAGAGGKPLHGTSGSSLTHRGTAPDLLWGSHVTVCVVCMCVSCRRTLQMGLLQEKLQEKATEAMQLYQQLFALRKLLPAELLATQAQVSTALPASSLPMQSARRAWQQPRWLMQLAV